MLQPLDYFTAVHYGFPSLPRRGQRVRDAGGNVWEWSGGRGGSGLGNLGDLGFFWIPIIAAAISAGGQVASSKIAGSAADKARKQQEEQAKREAEERVRQEELAWAQLKAGETPTQRAIRKCSANPQNPKCAPGGKLSPEGIKTQEQATSGGGDFGGLLSGGNNWLLWVGLAVGAYFLLSK